MKKCLINFARSNGHGGHWYARGQQRLKQSLEQVKFDGDVLLFNSEESLGAPRHEQSPYGFKPFALKRAVDLGYDLILWADASVWAIRPIQPMFDHMEKNGWMLFFNCSTGNWTSDACLNGFGLSRDQAMEVPMLMGICMGWNMTSPKCREFLNLWLAKAVDGFSFPGDWTNKFHQVSNDPRVYGHRHDQSVASILAWKLGMSLITPHETYFQYYTNPSHTAFNGDMSMVGDKMVMVAQGM